MRVFSDFFRNQQVNVPDSNNNLSLLDKHDQEVKEIQKLKSLVLSISNSTEGQGVSEIPTTTQTITFIENMEKGMSVRYDWAKKPKPSTVAQTFACADIRISGQNKGGQYLSRS